MDSLGGYDEYLNKGVLPKLPGFSVYKPVERASARPQQLRYINGIPGLYPDVRGFQPKMVRPTSAPVRRPLVNELPTKVNPRARGAPSPLPTVEADVLRFYGYFSEAIPERREERNRIRKVTVLYFLVDGSLHITEPKEQNSGLPQGVFLKKHPVPGITYDSLLIGGSFKAYGREFFIVGCDDFTRGFMALKGHEMSADIAVPKGDFENYKSIFSQKSALPEKASLNSRKFIDYDRQVLRFYALWDDTKSAHGEKHKYIIHYYLADDTMEVRETNEPNCGRDPFPLLLKRCKLPKKLHPVGMRPMSADSRKVSPYECYTPLDLVMGGEISVYTRNLFIYDCDDFTRSYCISDLGRSANSMQAIELDGDRKSKVEVPVPPHNGFGREKDSLQNCLHLIPKPAKRDLHDFIEKDGKVMRFVAKLVDVAGGPAAATESERRFLLNFYLVDDTCSVFEPPQRNSGVVGGKFLERAEIRKADGGDYKESDFFVGAKITISRRVFEMVEADEFTMLYMEENIRLFPNSSIDYVTAQIQTEVKKDILVSKLIEAEGKGHKLDAKVLDSCLVAAGSTLPKQAAATVMRAIKSANINDIVSALELD